MLNTYAYASYALYIAAFLALWSVARLYSKKTQPLG